MRWLAVTVALLGACAALAVGIFLRDRTSGPWLPPQRQVAHADAMSIAAAIGGTCPRYCRVKLLAHPRQNHWTARIVIPTTTRCVDINVLTFATKETHGIAGVTEVRCGINQ